MTIRNTTLLAAALAAALGLGVSAVQAQGHHTYTRTTTVTHYTYRAHLTSSQKEAKRLHRQAVRLDHRATYEDQHGHPKIGASLARQASDLNAKAFRLAHHRN